VKIGRWTLNVRMFARCASRACSSGSSRGLIIQKGPLAQLFRKLRSVFFRADQRQAGLLSVAQNGAVLQPKFLKP